MDTQGVRKFTLRSGLNNTVVKAWIFAPDITISSSAAETSDPIRAVKILWQDSQEQSEESGALTRQALSEGEMDLAPDELSHLRKILAQSAALLPENARTFQSWNVALLPRFTAGDVESTATELLQRQSPALLPEVPNVQNKEILSPLTS